MKNKILILAGICVLFIGILMYGEQSVRAIGAVLRSGADVPEGSLKMRTGDATSTPIFMQDGKATTTLTFASDNFSALKIDLQVFASSTNIRSPLNISLKASDDNIDFFDYDPTVIEGSQFINSQATSSIALASTTKLFFWQPAFRGVTSTKSVILPFIPAKYTRIIFTMSTTTSTATDSTYRDGMNLWANVTGQNSGVK